MRVMIYLLFTIWGYGLKAGVEDLDQGLDSMPTEVLLNDGDLRMVNIFKLQAQVLLEMEGRSEDEIVAAMEARVYTPYKAFFDTTYHGDEKIFRLLTTHYVMKQEPPVTAQIHDLLETDVIEIYRNVASELVLKTGQRPKGTWFLFWGNGQFDMGCPSPGLCIVDWALQKRGRRHIEALLPHELTHMIQKELQGDLSKTVLNEAVTEGFGSYSSYRFWEGGYSEAACLLFSDEDYEWCVRMEDDIKNAVRGLMESKDQEVIARLTLGQKPFKAGWPDRLGYFVGFQICKAFEQKQGPGSWKRIYKLSPEEVVAASGYFD